MVISVPKAKEKVLNTQALILLECLYLCKFAETEAVEGR